jgi:hypothetical protein
MARQVALSMILPVVCAWLALVALVTAEAVAADAAERFIINLYVSSDRLPRSSS